MTDYSKWRGDDNRGGLVDETGRLVAKGSHRDLLPLLRAAKKAAELEVEVGRLRAWIECRPCECRDEYGVAYPFPCDRCAVLGLKVAKAAEEKR